MSTKVAKTIAKKGGSNTMLYVGIGLLGIVGIASATGSTPKVKTGAETFDDPTPTPANPTPSNGGGTVVIPAKAIDKNLLLKKGSKGNEVKELQKLLNVTADGDFGSKTETALYNLKRVKQITLNNFLKVASVNTNAYVVGDKIMSNLKPSCKLFEAAKNAAGSYYQTGKVWTTREYGQSIGTIKGMNATKTMYLTSVRDWGDNIDVYVFVNASSVKKY